MIYVFGFGFHGLRLWFMKFLVHEGLVFEIRFEDIKHGSFSAAFIRVERV